MGLLLMMVCVTCSYSQVALNFCASVEPTGYCNFNNTKFISSKDSTTGRINMEVRSITAPIGAATLLFKIYKLDEKGKEVFVTMVSQAIKPDWYFAWTPYMFNSPGKYAVKVYNESDQVICSNAFEFIAF